MNIYEGVGNDSKMTKKQKRVDAARVNQMVNIRMANGMSKDEAIKREAQMFNTSPDDILHRYEQHYLL